MDQDERDMRTFALAPLASILVWGVFLISQHLHGNWQLGAVLVQSLVFTFLTWLCYIPSLLILPFMLPAWRKTKASKTIRIVPFGAVYGYLIARYLTPGLAFLYLGPISGIVVGIALCVGLHKTVDV
jgi:hypothetical protein